jgi:predicted Zn-dependent protease
VDQGVFQFDQTKYMIVKQMQHVEVVLMEDAAPTHAGSSMTGEPPETKPTLCFPLQETDSFHLRVAVGWIGLGDHAAASEQLMKISPEQRTHPAVLKVRWQVCVNVKNWEAALDVAYTLVRLDPKESLGWSNLSYALHELKRTAEARDNLLRVVETFSDNAAMRYNLACYESQLGRTEEAKRWLVETFKLGDKRRMTQMALTDSDLKPLQEWITLVATSSRLVLNNQRSYPPRPVPPCGETVIPSSQAA